MSAQLLTQSFHSRPRASGLTTKALRFGLHSSHPTPDLTFFRRQAERIALPTGRDSFRFINPEELRRYKRPIRGPLEPEPLGTFNVQALLPSIQNHPDFLSAGSLERFPFVYGKPSLHAFLSEGNTWSWEWTTRDLAIFQRSLKAIKNYSRDGYSYQYDWQQVYGIGWNLLGFSFEVFSRGFILAERLTRLRKIYPQAVFIPGRYLNFKWATESHEVSDGVIGILDDNNRRLTILELYEIKSQRDVDVAGVYAQAKKAKERLEQRGQVSLFLEGVWAPYAVEFKREQILTPHNIALVIAESDRIKRGEIDGTPLFTIPFPKDEVLRLIYTAILNEIRLRPSFLAVLN